MRKEHTIQENKNKKGLLPTTPLLTTNKKTLTKKNLTHISFNS